MTVELRASLSLRVKKARTRKGALSTRFEFPEICRGDWNSIFQNFRKRRQPCEGISVPFDFTPGNPWIFSWMVNSLFGNQQFPDFWKSFWENFSTICIRFEIFGIFGWMESTKYIKFSSGSKNCEKKKKKHKEVTSNQKLFSNYNRGISRQTANDKHFENFFFSRCSFHRYIHLYNHS